MYVITYCSYSISSSQLCSTSFTLSYLDPKALPKALLSMDGCQITVAEGKYEQGSPILSSC